MLWIILMQIILELTFQQASAPKALSAPIAWSSYKISAVSMEPTLKVGESVRLLRKNPADLKRGDLVIFLYPRDPDQTFVKRLVALPGDTVEVKQDRLILNGKLQTEDYLKMNPEMSYSPDFGPFLLKPNQFFVLGDNRQNSADSRIWGAVAGEQILGIVWR